jgi:hypothetical protein
VTTLRELHYKQLNNTRSIEECVVRLVFHEPAVLVSRIVYNLSDRVQLQAGPSVIGCGHLSGIWMDQKNSSSWQEEETKFRMLTAYGSVLSSVM